MPKQDTHVAVVRQWLQSLGVLSAISISRAEAEMKLAAFTPMLMQRFPDAAFTPQSLEHVARYCTKGFPSYGELADHLTDWWRDNRPAPVALPPPPAPPPREPPTPEELAAVHAMVRDVTAALRAPQYPDQDYGARPRHLDPAVLDRINPLPNGRKRAHATDPTATVDHWPAPEAFGTDDDGTLDTTAAPTA